LKLTPRGIPGHLVWGVEQTTGGFNPQPPAIQTLDEGLKYRSCERSGKWNGAGSGGARVLTRGHENFLGRHSGVFRNQSTGAGGKKISPTETYADTKTVDVNFLKTFFYSFLLFLQQSLSFRSYRPPAPSTTQTAGVLYRRRIFSAWAPEGHRAPLPPAPPPGAGRKTIVSGSRAVSGTFEKGEERQQSVERELAGNGNGAVSGSPKNWWSVKRPFSPLPLFSHALV
jgi:hypothetical protein